MNTLGLEVVYRLAASGDCEGISLCLRAAFEEFRPCYTREAFEDTVPSPAQVQHRLTHMCVYVAVNPGQGVIGSLASSIEDDTGHLRGMAVHPAWQVHGIAGRLLHMAENDLIAAGCNRLTLDTTSPLQKAIRFYRSRGFNPSGRVTDFFGMPLYEYEKRLRSACS